MLQKHHISYSQAEDTPLAPHLIKRTQYFSAKPLPKVDLYHDKQNKMTPSFRETKITKLAALQKSDLSKISVTTSGS